MRPQRCCVAVLLVMIAGSLAKAEEEIPQTGLKGPYLGMEPPGPTPRIFAPGVVSTTKSELNLALSPDGNELFYTIWKAGQNTLMTMRQSQAGAWSSPEVAPFSGAFSDVDPYYSKDGRWLYFSSMRPLSGQGDTTDSNLWRVKKDESGWGQPEILDGVNTLGKDDYYTSITRDGALYLSVFDGHGQGGDIYVSRLVEGSYAAPELVPSPISTSSKEHDPMIAPDGSYLIFTSDRPGGYGRGDLYISFRSEDGSWQEPVNLGPEINSPGYDFCAMLSPDEKYLFFTRNIDRNGDIYWVEAEVLQQLRPPSD